MANLNREAWLQKAAQAIRKAVFAPKGLTVPEVHISVGFPSRKALSLTQRVVGQCWAGEASADGSAHIFITPLLGEAEALDTLVHEMLHAFTPGEHHGGMFKRLMPVIGLEGKPTNAGANAALKVTLAEIAGKLGPYPHSVLTATGKLKTQTTRLLKVQCTSCGYVARVTNKWLEVGTPICPADEIPMEIPSE